MRLFKFDNYDHYVRVQTACNKLKLDVIWLGKREAQVLIETVKRLVPSATFGICHGVRNGTEVRYLREALNINVIGTEISDTAERFENVIQWDFHDVKLEWLRKVDFIYSNSFDHSHNPGAAISSWMSCLSEQGVCIIHWSTGHDYPEFAYDGADCFQAPKSDYLKLFEPYELVEVVEIGDDEKQCLIVIRNRRV